MRHEKIGLLRRGPITKIRLSGIECISVGTYFNIHIDPSRKIEGHFRVRPDIPYMTVFELAAIHRGKAVVFGIIHLQATNPQAANGARLKVGKALYYRAKKQPKSRPQNSLA